MLRLDDLQGFLFLDFDGVLNRVGSTGQTLIGVPHTGLDRDCVERVARLVKGWDLGVVISSMWRTAYPVAQLQVFLRAHGGDAIANRIVGTTVVSGDLRGIEIETTRAQFPWMAKPYVILDDAKSFLPGQPLIRTASPAGFTEDDFAAACRELQRQGCSRHS
jgi:hypothetical protein